MKVPKLILIILCLLLNTSNVEAKGSLFGQNILDRNSLERKTERNYPSEFFKVRIISILANPKNSDQGNTKLIIENNHQFKIFLKGWYLQTRSNIYYFQDEFLESNEIKSFTKIGNYNIHLKNNGDLVNLYDQNARLIQQLAYKSSIEDLHLSLDKTTGLFQTPVEINQTDQNLSLITNDKKEIIKAPEIKKYDNQIPTIEEKNLTLNKKIEISNQSITTDFFPQTPSPLSTYIILFLLIGSGLVLIIKKDRIIKI